MTMRAPAGAIACVLALVACGTNAVVVAPVIDVPTNNQARPFPLDTIVVQITHAGADPKTAALTSATFKNGDNIEVVGVPFADDLVMHIVGGLNESAYGRTCPFAVSASSPVATPHLYFAASNTIGDLGVATVAPVVRVGGAAVTYHDGSAIFVGGVDPSNPNLPVQDVERYDSTSGKLDVVASVAPRIGGTIALFAAAAPSVVAVIGGVDPSGAAMTFSELVEVDTATDRRVTPVPDRSFMTSPTTTSYFLGRPGLVATTLSDGRVLLTGGPPAVTDTATTADVFILGNSTQGITDVGTVGSLAVARRGHTATLLGDEPGAPVLIAGGLDETLHQPVQSAELFVPEANSLTTNGSMRVPRSQHQALRLPDNSVLIFGGIDAGGAAVKTIERFTVLDGFNAVVGLLPDSAPAVDFTATLLPSAIDSVRVLITGGRAAPGGPPLATATLLFFATGPTGGASFATGIPLSVARANPQATLMCDGMVAISGGTSALEPVELFDPGSRNQR